MLYIFISILYIGLHILLQGDVGGGTGKVLPIIHRKTRWLGNGVFFAYFACLFWQERLKIGS